MKDNRAIAVKPAEIQQFGDTTVTFGGQPSDAEALAEKKLLLSVRPNLTNAWSIMSATAKPEYGHYMSIRVDNYGDTDIELKYTITLSGGQVIEDTEIIGTDNFTFYSEIKNETTGLSCEVQIQLKTCNAGETGVAEVAVFQW